MKTLKELLFTTFLLVGCLLVAFGQSNDKKQDPPPKGNGPIIKVPPKETPKPTPTPTPKKPNSEEGK